MSPTCDFSPKKGLPYTFRKRIVSEFTQVLMIMPMISNVMLVVPDGGEEGLLNTEVFVVEGLQAVPQLLVLKVGLHVPDNVEKPDVLVVHLLVTDGIVTVLDVLSEPVLGLVGRLLGDG